MGRGFEDRVLTGWISEFVIRPLPGTWPQIPLDDETIGDLERYFDLCHDVGYTHVVLWGLFVDRRWPEDITSCVSDDRRQRIHRVIDAGHKRGVKIISGLGLYSWGFDEIIERHPELSRTNRRAMCPATPSSHEWMDKVTDFVLGQFDLDGLNLQSADQGRCTCDDCRDLSTVDYHVRLNRRVAQYIRQRWKGKFLMMDNWGCPFGDPADWPRLVELSRDVDCINDFNDSSTKMDPAYRKKLIAQLHCAFGTLSGWSVWPPQRWSVDKYFLPTTLVNVDYMRGLYEDGGRAVEQFTTNLGNPADEITLRFMGALASDVSADPEALLRQAVGDVYGPKDTATLDGLVDAVRKVESAYFDSPSRPTGPHAGPVHIDGGLKTTKDPSPESYLINMAGEDRASFIKTVKSVAGEFKKLILRIGHKEKGELTARCLANVIADAQRISAES